MNAPQLTTKRLVDEFLSEDDLQTFEGWLRYQAVDASSMTPEDLETWRRIAATPKVGLMKLQPVPGEYRYAVAVREGQDLWLTLWVRCSRKGEFFVMLPCGDRDWDPHTSYHLDGTLHMKSYDTNVLQPKQRQPLTDVFRGTEPLGVYYGHAPKSVGAICAPIAFSGIIEVAPNVLGPNQGAVAVDLVEPGQEPVESGLQIVTRKVFRDIRPWVVITVGVYVGLTPDAVAPRTPTE